jgi:hypothetical protein
VRPLLGRTGRCERGFGDSGFGDRQPVKAVVVPANTQSVAP